MDVNVRVAVRCRPLSQKEIARGCIEIVKMTTNSVHIDSIDTQKPERDFTFDFCYFTNSTQDQVYKDIGHPLVEQALDGFNGTIFAYGQTGSGKSFSMMGSDSEKGIIPRLNEDLWSNIDSRLAVFASEAVSSEKKETKYLVTVSFLEIYNEIIRDLLNPSDKQLRIRENKESGIYVEGLCELIVRDAAEIMKLIVQGNAVRRVAATNMNEHSSRSHSCFTLKLERKISTELANGATREQITRAKLNLVDLAGSERAAKTGASGDTLKEGANINMSLMALGNVINALSEGKSAKNKHIPYRDSTLTRLLQESLGGNSSTLMIAAISPADYNYEETVGTLKYANRAKSIANEVTRNEDLTERMIRDLKDQIEALKRQLANGGGDSASAIPGASNPELSKKLEEMEASQRNVWEEKERLQSQLEAERQHNLNQAISSMMKSVKEDKVNRMKAIKRLTNEKTSLSKEYKDSKDSFGQMKEKLDTTMKRYQEFQQKYEDLSTLQVQAAGTAQEAEYTSQLENLAGQMSSLLTQIEEDRSKWLQMRENIKKMKDRLSEIEELMTEERAELVATAGILDQNDKIRSQIQEEERQKAQQVIAEEVQRLRESVEKERLQVRGSLEEEMKSELQHWKEEVADIQKMWQQEIQRKEEALALYKQSQSEAEIFENRLAEAEVSQEGAWQEVEMWKKKYQEEIVWKQNYDKLKAENERIQQEYTKSLEDKDRHWEQECDRRVSAALKQAEQEKFDMFRTLIDQFELERKEMKSANDDAKKMLAQAVKDVLFLGQKNEDLKKSLTMALQWEPRIK